MAYTENREPDQLTALTSLASGDVFVVGDVSDANEAAKYITYANLITDLADETQTLSNKSISLGSNTITGTTAQFNTALSDGSFATLAGSETLTNKTLDADNNTVSNIGFAEIKGDLITGATEEATPASGDYFLMYDTSAGALRKIDSDNMPGSGGGSALTVQDEGVSLSTAATKLNFVGAGVTATEPVADEITVTISGAAVNFADGETPSGAVNGSNTTYTLANTPSPTTSLHVYLNGLRQTLTTDYSYSNQAEVDFVFSDGSTDFLFSDGSDFVFSEAGAGLTFVTAPPSGATLRVDYRY